MPLIGNSSASRPARRPCVGVSRWGAPLAGPPVIAGNRLFATLRSGRLLMLDAASGVILKSARFAESLAAAPGISADGELLYVATERGNLFVINAKDFHSSAAIHLGFPSGSMTLAPVVWGKFLILTCDRGFENSELRILTLRNEEGAIKPVQRISLAGHIGAAPVVAGAGSWSRPIAAGWSSSATAGRRMLPSEKSPMFRWPAIRARRRLWSPRRAPSGSRARELENTRSTRPPPRPRRAWLGGGLRQTTCGKRRFRLAIF